MSRSLDLKSHSASMSRDTWHEYEEARGCTEMVIKQSPLIHVTLSTDLVYRIDTPEAKLVAQLWEALGEVLAAGKEDPENEG